MKNHYNNIVTRGSLFDIREKNLNKIVKRIDHKTNVSI